jgi:hypothetical protein
MKLSLRCERGTAGISVLTILPGSPLPQGEALQVA